MDWFVDFFAIIVLCSVQGSIVYYVYLMFEKMRVSSENICLNYRIAKWVTLLYVMPLAYLIDKTYWNNGFVFQTVPSIRQVCIFFGIFWAVGVVYRIIQYCRECSGLRKMVVFSKLCKDETTIKCFRKVKKDLGIRKKVSVRVCELDHSPFVFGIRETCIMIPDRSMSIEMLTVVFTHELIHIKNGDIFWKYLIGIVRCIHWFNPLTMMLRDSYEVWSESYDDFMSGKYLNGWKKYFLLLLHMASGTSNTGSSFSASLKEKHSEISERVNRIYRRNIRIRRIGVVLLMVLSICAATSVSVLGAAKGYQHIYTPLQYHAEKGIEVADIWIAKRNGILSEKGNTFIWELKPYSRKMTSKYAQNQGSQFFVQVTNVGDTSIEAGFLNSNNDKYYFNVCPHCTVQYTFVVPETDIYRFYTANWNNENLISISSCYIDS